MHVTSVLLSSRLAARLSGTRPRRGATVNDTIGFQNNVMRIQGYGVNTIRIYNPDLVALK